MIRHEIKAGKDVSFVLYGEMKQETEYNNNIENLIKLISILFDNKDYLFIQAPGKFFTNFSMNGHISQNGSHRGIHSLVINKPDTDRDWRVFFSHIDNFIIDEFGNKDELESACLEFDTVERNWDNLRK
jgi:ATP-dependent exoDNAse (exonuclease V) alpha subunit